MTGNHSRNPVQHFYSHAQIQVIDLDIYYYQTLGRIGKHQMIDWRPSIPKIIITVRISSWQMHLLRRVGNRSRSKFHRVENQGA